MGCTQQAQRLDLVNQKSSLTASTKLSQDQQARRTYIHAVLSGIQDLSRRNREERLKFVAGQQSLEGQKQYVAAIQKSIESQQLKIAQLVKVLTNQLGTSEFSEKELYSDIVSYLQLRKIDQQEVENWIAAKIKIVKVEGKGIGLKLKGVQAGRNVSKIQIFQTMVEDRLQGDKGFLLSVAYEFIYQNCLSSRGKWVSCLQQIQRELDFVSK